MLTPFSGLHCFIPSCKSTGICWCSVQCCVQLWKEAVCLSKGQSKDMDSVASCLLPGMELENKYILISNFCVVLFFFSFKIRKITRITFKKMNLLTVVLLACKCWCDYLDLKCSWSQKGDVFIHSFIWLVLFKEYLLPSLCHVSDEDAVNIAFVCPQKVYAFISLPFSFPFPFPLSSKFRFRVSAKKFWFLDKCWILRCILYPVCQWALLLGWNKRTRANKKIK